MTLPHRLYVGTIGEGLYRSTDGGQSYTRSWRGMFVECFVRALVVHPQDPATLFLGNEHGLFKSEDGAESWVQVSSLADGKQVWSLLVPKHDPNTLLVGTCPSAIFRSTDSGKTWQQARAAFRQDCPRIIHTRVTTLAGDPTLGDTLFAGIEIDGVWRSTDYGASWEKASRGISSEDIHSIMIVPGSPARVLVVTDNDINLSTDSGSNWKPLSLGKQVSMPYSRGLAQRPGAPEVLLVGLGDGPPGTQGGIARSTDAAQTWRTSELSCKPNSTIWSFATNAADPDLIYAASVSGEIHRSTDGGSSWSKLAREFGEIRALAWTPAL